MLRYRSLQPACVRLRLGTDVEVSMSMCRLDVEIPMSRYTCRLYIYLYPYYGAGSTNFYSAFPGPLPTRSRIAERPPPDAAWSRLGAVLGPSCARPGLPGGRLGAVLGPLWTSSGPSWGHVSAFAAKKATLPKVYVFPRFWPLFGLSRSLAAVKLGST